MSCHWGLGRAMSPLGLFGNPGEYDLLEDSVVVLYFFAMKEEGT